MIKAVIFDCFGVLTTDGWLPFKEKHFGHDPALLQQAVDLNKRSSAGFLAYNDFLQEIAELAHMSASQVRYEIENNVANEKLFNYIATDLKPHYAVGLLSNASANWLDELFTPQQVALFDAIALSYDIGVVKPDTKAYHIIAQQLGVDPSQAVFIDDQERYCDAARQAGMQAVHYNKDSSQVIRQLNDLLSG